MIEIIRDVWDNFKINAQSILFLFVFAVMFG